MNSFGEVLGYCGCLGWVFLIRWASLNLILFTSHIHNDFNYLQGFVCGLRCSANFIPVLCFPQENPDVHCLIYIWPSVHLFLFHFLFVFFSFSNQCTAIGWFCFYWCDPFALQREVRPVAQGQEGAPVQECPKNHCLCGKQSPSSNISSFKRLKKKKLNLENFQVGGCCFSELRCAYEITNDKKNWEIIMGQQSAYMNIFIMNIKRSSWVSIAIIVIVFILLISSSSSPLYEVTTDQ